MLLKYQLPQIYQKLLPREVLEFAPQEKKADCENCSMARPHYKGPHPYREDLKCCTFHPFVPNYMVGALLYDENAGTAHKVLSKKIEQREYALPIGMVAPVAYQVPFNKRKDGEFGQREDWLCPYYDRQKNNCSIWRNRGVVCTTFFCMSSYGDLGMEFWDKMNSYLWYVELALLEEALVLLDFSPRQVMELLDYHNRQKGSKAELGSLVLPEKKARELWNGYFEDQAGFYKKSFDIVSNLDKTEFHEMLGETGQLLEEELFETISALNELGPQA